MVVDSCGLMFELQIPLPVSRTYYFSSSLKALSETAVIYAVLVPQCKLAGLGAVRI